MEDRYQGSRRAKGPLYDPPGKIQWEGSHTLGSNLSAVDTDKKTAIDRKSVV